LKRSHAKIREEARELFLTGQVETNAELAARLRVKPHTIGRWRRDEDWDGLRTKVDIRAAELFVEKIANERVTLSVRHYRYWELLLAKLADDLKGAATLDIRDLERIAVILDRAQKGQRLAKGLSTTGETEEAIRAQAEAEMRRIIDAFVEAVKEHVDDQKTRDRIRKAIIKALPEEEGAGTREPGNEIVQ